MLFALALKPRGRNEQSQFLTAAIHYVDDLETTAGSKIDNHCS